MSAGGSLVGRVLDDRYRVIAEIGRGGHGTVYRGLHLQLDRPVAIKVMAHPSAGVERRFRREAQAQARLRHPAVVKLLDFGHDHDGNPFMVQEFVDGESLQARLKRGVPPLDETVLLIGDLLDALAEAHALELVHRDVKPSNIMLARGPRRLEARLLDFGVVKLLDPDAHTRLTRAGALVGTPGYMAPEQIALLPVTPATDLYSTGVVLYQCLAGQRPYGGPIKTVLRAQLHDDAPPLPAHVSPAMAAVALTALSREPAGRHADADAMRAALLAAFEEARGAPTRVARSEPPARRSGALPRLTPTAAPTPTPAGMIGTPSLPSMAAVGTPRLPDGTLPSFAEPARTPIPTPRAVEPAPGPPSGGLPTHPTPHSGTHPTPHSGTHPPPGRGLAPVALLAILLALGTAGLTAWWTSSEPEGPVHRVRAGDRPVDPSAAAPTRPRPPPTVMPTVRIDDPPDMAADAAPDAEPPDAAARARAPSPSRRTPRRVQRRPTPRPDAAIEPDAASPAESRLAEASDVQARIEAAFAACACDEALDLVDALARFDSAAARLRRSQHRRRCRLALPGNCVTGGP